MEIDLTKKYSFTEIGRNGWLGVGPAGVYNLIRAGKLAYIIVGTGKKNKRYSILGSDVEKYIESNRHEVIKQF